MSRPPRPVDEPLFGWREMMAAAAEGAVLLGAVLALYLWMLSHGGEEALARTVAFVALVAGNLALALAVGSSLSAALIDRRRVAFWIIAPLAAGILATCILAPGLAQILRFTPPAPATLAAAVAIGVIAGGWPRPARLLAAHLAARTAPRPPEETRR
jgi:Ca2+-transporting ATPase